MARPRTDLVVVLALVVLDGLLLWLWPAESALRSGLGVAVVLAAPGYAWQAALFGLGDLASPLRVLLTLGLSLATGVIGGLVLFWTPFGLQTNSWYVWFAGVTLVGCAIAYVRHPRTQSAPRPAGAPPSQAVRLRWQPVLLLSLALLISGTALFVSRLPAPPDSTQGYTQLWMVPAPTGAPPVVQLGIASSEFSLEHYRLQVTLDGQLILDIQDLPLGPGEKWERAVALSVGTRGGLVDGRLYRLDQPEAIYRRVTVSLP